MDCSLASQDSWIPDNLPTDHVLRRNRTIFAGGLVDHTHIERMYAAKN